LSAVDRLVVGRLPQTGPAHEPNQALVRNVHPPDWVNPQPAGRYNLVVIGAGTAGPIGCEKAQAFAQLGSDVFLVETEHGILPREDRDAADVVQKMIMRDGVNLFCCGKDLAIKDNGGIRLVVRSHGLGYDEPIDKLLVAVGRAPNVEHLNLEAVGVDYDRKGVKVDERMRTTNPMIYAAGDVCSPCQARKKGIAVDTFVQELRDVDRAILDGEDEGFVKVHVKKGTDTLVGATIVARHAGDLISEITLAMTHGLGLKQIGGTIHPYPTQAEAIRKLGDQFSRTRLTPFVKRLFGKWLAWTR